MGKQCHTIRSQYMASYTDNKGEAKSEWIFWTRTIYHKRQERQRMSDDHKYHWNK